MKNPKWMSKPPKEIMCIPWDRDRDRDGKRADDRQWNENPILISNPLFNMWNWVAHFSRFLFHTPFNYYNYYRKMLLCKAYNGYCLHPHVEWNNDTMHSHSKRGSNRNRTRNTRCARIIWGFAFNRHKFVNKCAIYSVRFTFVENLENEKYARRSGPSSISLPPKHTHSCIAKVITYTENRVCQFLRSKKS